MTIGLPDVLEPSTSRHVDGKEVQVWTVAARHRVLADLMLEKLCEELSDRLAAWTDGYLLLLDLSAVQSDRDGGACLIGKIFTFASKLKAAHPQVRLGLRAHAERRDWFEERHLHKKFVFGTELEAVLGVLAQLGAVKP